MGLNKLDPRHWVLPCRTLPHYQQNKIAARHAMGDRVYAQLPASLPIQRELATQLYQHLIYDHTNYLCAADSVLRWCAAGSELRWPGLAPQLASAEPLWGASCWVADDICLLQPGQHGYTLVAASLAAPSYWRLEEKIGRPLDQIHGPVPGFQQKLSARVARFFDHLKPEFPVWRSNWSVVDSPQLLQRAGEVTDSKSACMGQPRRLYLRIERQTLRRLPATGAVVFTIRVTINPLEDLLLISGGVAALRDAVLRMSPEETRYKSLAPLLAEEGGPLRRFFTEHGYSINAGDRTGLP
nr:DUF3445 domain-containing protein [Microbulbifer sp. HZ11]